jgi:hypothetical protein
MSPPVVETGAAVLEQEASKRAKRNMRGRKIFFIVKSFWLNDSKKLITDY